MEKFPQDILLLIFRYFSYRDLGSLAQVCKKFYQISVNPNLPAWKELDFYRYRNIVNK